MLRRIVASCSTLFLLFASIAAVQAQALPDGCSSAYVCVVNAVALGERKGALPVFVI